MLNWILKKGQNFRFNNQVQETNKTIEQFKVVERAYILLYVAMLRETMGTDMPQLAKTLDNPHSFSRDEIMKIYYFFEDMRNATVNGIEQLKGMAAAGIMPEKVQKHMLYSLHSLNVIMATLAPALIHDGAEHTRRLWVLLKSSHEALPESISLFREALKFQESMGDHSASSGLPFASDDEWISCAKWIPEVYRERSING